VRERLDVREHGSARRRETGHALEIGIDRPIELAFAREEVGQGRDGGRDDPDERHDQEALPCLKHATAAREPLDEPAGTAHQHAREQERDRCLAVADRDRDRHERGEAEVLRERAHEVCGAA
jgi:hypothetical protein